MVVDFMNSFCVHAFPSLLPQLGKNAIYFLLNTWTRKGLLQLVFVGVLLYLKKSLFTCQFSVLYAHNLLYRMKHNMIMLTQALKL